MTISEITNKLSKEREFGSRFPVRIIFVDNLKNYKELLSHLQSACDEMINVADFGRGDVVPQFDKIREYLKTHEGQQILLLSVGEYIRLCFKREMNKERAQFYSLWELMQSEMSLTRIVIPLFSCRDYFDRIIGKPNERQESFIWKLDEEKPSEHFELSIYTPQFLEAIKPNATNIEDWLRNWMDILEATKTPKIITKQYKNVEEAYGKISIKLIDSPFAYVHNFVKDLDTENKSLETEDFWAKLSSIVRKDMTFASLATMQLNVAKFNFCDVIAKWQMLNDFQRELVWLWYRIYPTDEYCSYACRKAETANEIPERIRDEILLLSSRNQKWIEERMRVMLVIKFSSFNDDYFSKIDKLSLPELKLQMLTYKTHEECAFAIKVVSNMLRNGADVLGVASMIRQGYPLLYEYMSSSTGLDDEIDEYFSWYRKNKLINRFTHQPPYTFSYDRIDARFKILQENRKNNGFEFWIDGFGIEWLPVLLYELKCRNVNPESIHIAKSKLPTETEYNHQWETDDPLSKKWDKLDKLSHNGMPDDKSYFSCIAYQLDVFKNVAREIDTLLNEHEYVTITGDHGSSRLAALGFHSKEIVPTFPPKDAIIRSFGRFCELPSKCIGFTPLDYMQTVSENGTTFVVMKDYNRFSIGGNAAGGNTDEQDVVGEVHGGATPEERLVPVVILHRPKPLPALTCEPRANKEYVKNGRVETVLKFNRNISSLEVKFGTISGVCSLEVNGWHVSFENIASDKLILSVIADGNILDDNIVIELRKRGIASNDGGVL